MSSTAYLLSLRTRLRDADTRIDTADALAELALAEMRTGCHADAMMHLEDLTTLSKQEPSAEIEALIAYTRGVFDFYAGRTAASVTNALHARRGARVAQSAKLEARSLAVLCNALARLGAHGDALEYGSNAIELGESIGDDRAIVTARIAFANLYVEREDGRAALRELDAAVPAMRRLDDPITRASLNSSRVAALVVNARQLMANPNDDALKLVRQTIDTCRAGARAADESGHLKARVFLWSQLAQLHMLVGERVDAFAVIDHTIELCETENAADNFASVLQLKANYLVAQGRHEEAIPVLERAHQYALEADYLSVQALIEADRVICYEKIGDLPHALEAAKAHARCLLMQRTSERANLDIMAKVKREFAEAQRAAIVARAQAAELNRTHVRLIEDTQKLKRISFEDALTRLKNRRYFDFRFPDLIMQQREACKVLSIAIVDIDHFKSINDRSGHLAGDEVLREVAKVLHAHCGAKQEVCRLGGDEFILLLPDLDAAAATELCDRARVALVESNIGRAHQVTLSIGIAELLPDENHTAFLTRADDKLFVAKREGRNRVAS